MLTGKPPFLSKNTAEVVVGHLNVVPEAPSKIRMDLNIPAALDAATMRALAKNPWERPTTVQEFCNTVTKAMEKPVTKTRSAKDVLENVMHPPKKNETPTPHGMVVDPVKKVCPNCKALSTGANYKYCLKCGQDNTNKWLPYHKKARKGGFDPIVFFQRYRTVLALLVLACVLGFSLHSYLEAGAELTGRFTGHLDHVMFAKDPLPPGVAKNLRVRDLEMLLSQNGEKVSGLITTKLGQGAVEGTVTAVSPMITSYELTGDIDKAGGTLDIEMTGMFDKVARTEDWTVKQYFHGPGIKPIASVAKMSLSKVKE
jgi:hypothetical protein